MPTHRYMNSSHPTRKDDIIPAAIIVLRIHTATLRWKCCKLKLHLFTHPLEDEFTIYTHIYIINKNNAGARVYDVDFSPATLRSTTVDAIIPAAIMVIKKNPSR